MAASQGANWFTTWDEDDESGKSFFLQTSLEGVSNPSLLHDSVNAYVELQRSGNGVCGPWEVIGSTSVVFDEKDPDFAEGFRVLYDQDTDLTKDMLRARVFHKHESALLSSQLIGEADVSLNELLRTFGTKLMVELLRPKTDKICGRIWFLGEALPSSSPRGGKNAFEFRIKLQTPPSDAFQDGVGMIGAPRLFLIVSRERTDGSWGVLYRTGYVKKGSTRISRKIHSRLRSYLIVPRFTLQQTNLILGGKVDRQIQVQVLTKCRKDDGHKVVGTSVFTVDDLIHDLRSDTSVDFVQDEESIGEFAVIERVKGAGSSRTSTRYSYDVEINFSDEKKNAEKIRKVKKQNRMKLDDI